MPAKLDISYATLSKFFTPRTTIENHVLAYFEYKERIQLGHVRLLDRPCWYCNLDICNCHLDRSDEADFWETGVNFNDVC